MKRVTIIGGGPAGIEAAACLAEQNIEVLLIEKEDKIGGHLNKWHHLFPDRKDAQEVRSYLDKRFNESGAQLLKGVNIERIEKREDKYYLYTDKTAEIISDALLLATGFSVFDAHKKEEYGYGIYPNVVTSVDLERMFSSGEVKTLAGKSPERIGMIHCVGSRDEKCGNFHCSKVCCITAVKQAIELKEKNPNAEVFCFYMDMRMFGNGYEEMYREAQEKYGIIFIRGRLSESSETIDGRLLIKVEDTLIGKPLKMSIDMLVLMVGMESPLRTKELVEPLGVSMNFNRFIKTMDVHTSNNKTSVEGVFAAGACTSPMNITETLSDARAVSSDIINFLAKKN